MLRELPEGWESKRLEEIAEINARFEKNSFDDDTEVTFLPMRCVEELTGRMDTTIEKKYGEIKTGYTPIREGDLLFAKITPCIENGKIAIAQNLKSGIGFASTEFHTLKFSPNCDTKFYFFFLMQEKIRQEAARNMTGTAGQQRVPVTFLKRLKVPVPPHHIQHKIVAVLEQAEAVKRQRQEADALTGALLQSVFRKMFGDPLRNEQGWDFAQLDELCSVITDGEHVTPRRTDSGIFLLSARNIQNHYISTSDVDFIDEEEYTRLSKHLIPQNGDVLVSCSGTVGRVTRVNVDYKFQLVRSVALMRPIIEMIDPVYLEYSFETQFMKDQVSKCVHQSSQANLFQGMIRKLKIPLPPLSLQLQFAHIVESVERLRDQQVASGREIEGLCEGLMQRAFAGELVE